MLGFLINADLVAWSEKSIEVIRPVEGVQSRATNYILGYSNALSCKNRLLDLTCCLFVAGMRLEICYFCMIASMSHDINVKKFIRFTSTAHLRNLVCL